MSMPSLGGSAPMAVRTPPTTFRAGRRQLDQDRLFEASEGMDGPAAARSGNRPDRDPGELVLRRPAADAIHQEIAEQPRICKSARHRADVARPVRLGLPRI